MCIRDSHKRAQNEGNLLISLVIATAVVFAVGQELVFQHHLH
jgi:hypothetical protein